jgi:hypothetical protein
MAAATAEERPPARMRSNRGFSLPDIKETKTTNSINLSVVLRVKLQYIDTIHNVTRSMV